MTSLAVSRRGAFFSLGKGSTDCPCNHTPSATVSFKLSQPNCDSNAPKAPASTSPVPPLPTQYHDYALPSSLPLHKLPQLAFAILQGLSLPGEEVPGEHRPDSFLS